ncbi:KRI1-like family C-terminal-domain-containing protein [Amylocarpus encephaloides]|uniref:KRI1-like family C-terminal-domain-containing protein n=1 Tax=Amylocarpus encephaloides TaxID=45428 RepID=A0A9P8C4Z9_9HELO|nr:KRI1-like family C-terminal-domain-containing protein [Amylocarpus encephaloides]
MAKRKADTCAESDNGAKKLKHGADASKSKQSLLEDTDASSSDDDSVGGVQLEPEFRVNRDFANRYEHNKKREELQKLEEKYNKPAKPANGKLYGDKYDEDSESSDDGEDEDDEGFLATEDLDAQISATLQAIRAKDPRVYDEKVTFYKPIEEEAEKDTAEAKKEKPMRLHDYHRENLLREYTREDEEASTPRTFVQEQEELKNSIVKEIHAAGDDSSSDEDEDGGFLIPKSKPKAQPQNESSASAIHPSRAKKVAVDVNTAEKDPETFLSNFMQARAWVPTDGARFQPLESDDDEELERAEEWETAYNLRFENPSGTNETLKSYARDAIAAKTVRKEEPNSRKKQRDMQKAKKDAEKAERDVERTRLRQLKIGEMEAKLQIIKKAAGLHGKALKEDEWTKFLDEGWDDATWEAEMSKRFGEDYYAEQDGNSDSDAEAGGDKKKKVHKPQWDDDIDIKDLVPDFVEEEEAQEKPAFSLSDSEGQDGEDIVSDADPKKKGNTSRDRANEKATKKKAARLERKKIEDLVDNQLDISLPLNSKAPSMFRYRETSPISFGLTTRDILMAPDISLNQFAGLKKMAAFRDADKKKRDKKNLGKKARLRQWRKETFGNEEGPEVVIQEGGLADGSADAAEKKKKKRSRKNKNKEGETTDAKAKA